MIIKMKYEFKVDPRAMYLMIDDMTEEKLDNYKKEFNHFIFRYNDNWEKTCFGLLAVLTGESADGQMLILGVDDNGNEEVLCYYFVGEPMDECSEEYAEENREYYKAIQVFKTIKKKYKIK